MMKAEIVYYLRFLTIFGRIPYKTCKQAVSKMKCKRIVNDLRVTDHHGLLITDKIPSALNVKENMVYDMIAFRLLEALSQPVSKR